MDQLELSEVCYGLIQEGRHLPSLYKSDWFCAPYNSAVDILSQPGKSKEDVAKVLSSAYMTDAADAVHKFNGIGEYANFDWPKALRKAHENVIRAKKLEKVAKQWKNNEDVDILPLYSELGAAISNDSFGLKPASSIDYKNYKPFMPCGYEPIDKTLGGIPTDGPIIVYGATGVGKSKFLTALTDGFLHKYPKKKAAIYTLEMNDVHWMNRTVNLFPDITDVADRLHISGQARDIEEIVAQVTLGQYDLVGLDDMDNLVKSSEAAEYERIYRRVKEICRFMGIPVIVLGQPNRAAKAAIDDGDRFLGRYDVAWSGSAENSAALQIALMSKVNSLDMHSEEFPTSDDNMDYIIFWKSRDGWPGDYDSTKAIGPGAIIMKHSPAWYGEPYGTRDPKKPNWKLWSVNSGGKKLGKNKKKEDRS
jgi:hypothetical protein